MTRFRRKIGKECGRMRMQRFGDSAEHRNGRITFSTFDRTEVAEVQTGAKGELFLRHPSRHPELADRGSDDAFPSHGQIGASVAMERLGHIYPSPVLGDRIHV